MIIISVAVAAGPNAAGAATHKTPKPVVTSLSVKRGTTLGGTRVVIHGKHFVHVRSVKFGTTSAHIHSVPSKTRIIVTTPAHPAGKVDVTVRTRQGRSAAAAPAAFRFVHDAVQVSIGNSGGQSFECVRADDKVLRCVGGNLYGEIGNGTTTNATSPVAVHGFPAGTTDVALATEFGCGVSTTHGAKCWGWEVDGSLGNGVDDDTKHSATPVSVHGLTTGVRSVAAGGNTACALMSSGAVKCWGSGSDGVLGTNNSSPDSAVPVTIAGTPSGITSLAVGANFACALRSSGAVWCWGANDYGQLGGGEVGAANPVPTAVTGLGKARAFGAGGETACAVLTTGRAYCWGDNGYGALGGGSLVGSDSIVPVRVAGLSNVASVAVSDNEAACALTKTGAVSCWGYNYDGQLGDGNQNNSPSPLQVSGLTSGVRSIALSTYTGCALTTRHAVTCWGYIPVKPGISDTPVTLPWFG